jgi:thiamine kinase-like enzyme
VNDFDMFTRQAGYLATIQQRGYRLPADYTSYADRWAAVEKALAAAPRPTVPCNNDLLAANFIDDGAKTWLIDYEYSGNNDASFELGNTATECGFSSELTEAWTAAYFGDPSPADLARVRVQALCSAYGWSLWGFIQAATSPLDFDFWSWGLERFEKAQRTFGDPAFPRLLEELAGG